MSVSHRLVYAYGDPGHPLIVGSLEQAIDRATAEANRTGKPQAILRVDLDRADLAPEVLGQATPDG